MSIKTVMHFHITYDAFVRRIDRYGERIAIQVENQEGKRIFFSYYNMPPGDEFGEIEHEITEIVPFGIQPNQELKACAHGFIRGKLVPRWTGMARKKTCNTATVNESGQVNFHFIIP